MLCLEQNEGKNSVVIRITPPPQHVHVLILGTYKYVKLHGKGEWKLQIELRLELQMGSVYWITEVGPVESRGFFKVEEGYRRQGQSAVMWGLNQAWLDLNTDEGDQELGNVGYH